MNNKQCEKYFKNRLQTKIGFVLLRTIIRVISLNIKKMSFFK